MNAEEEVEGGVKYLDVMECVREVKYLNKKEKRKRKYKWVWV